MKRLAITGLGRVEVIEYEERPLGLKEVRVATEVASGKHGTAQAMLQSINFRNARFDPEMRVFIEHGEKEERQNAAHVPTRERPWGVGTSGYGRVIEVGAEVRKWRAGDRVLGLFDVRETNVVHEDWLWPLDGLDPWTALCIEPAYVAFHSLRESGVRLGDTVAVIGLGAIGLMAVRMAKAAGAERIYAVDTIAKRRDLAVRYGADEALDPRAGDPAIAVHELNGGQGVDVAIDVAGTYSALNTAIRCARVAGTVCATGFYQGEANAVWLGREWHHNRLTMVVPHGCGWGHPPRDFPRWTEHRAYDAIVGLMRQGRLDVPGLIDPVIAIEEGPHVFDLIRERPEEVVKYAVRFT